jgi:hypothetical protein
MWRFYTADLVCSQWSASAYFITQPESVIGGNGDVSTATTQRQHRRFKICLFSIYDANFQDFADFAAWPRQLSRLLARKPLM